ncbi:hypothetical protein CL689_01450 [Candidatus Saccharibacteria bacterium]|nr:hypothetical protein [Candidatus Saccharibacteria bacterium]|tara:strand:- start:547 stop:1428 length:882 start_codon:yes stop_codon:yes gene_type:complete
MPELFLTISLAIFGLILGSFAGATVWRLRARQLLFDKKHGEKVDAKEWKRLQPLTRQKLRSDRSRCLHCRYELRWYDLIPLFSWLSLKGRCRQCRHKIGGFEPLIELAMATLFVVSYLVWPMPLIDPLSTAVFVVWLIACVVLIILAAYDLKWFLLPDSLSLLLTILGAASVVLTMIQLGDVWNPLWNAIGAVGILSGLYLVLYIVSRGRWIGFGDVKLGVGLGLLLGDWQLAFLALFLANLIGCFVTIPLMAAGKLQRTSHVPFGPLLIAGMIIAKFTGLAILSWYLSTFSF